ncbi:helix-turn-helix domain-containing protein [Paenibacillus sp. UNC451MF]|uniref:helix-turn-helix domain-containing protein n=1 Tax=Paenibacillus sp. UNC451MF TaxID=1449063 RepID=UPI000490094D|nr:helix-turn-helix transcriptional regulator [Paenibacillus sp. UNC451MF]
MDCLELQFPPMPHLMTVGFSKPAKGSLHYERSFPLYDIIIVKKGAFYMTEENVSYEINENELLVLEPFRKHWGHLPSPEGTEVYYLHLMHAPPLRTVSADDVQWTAVSPTPTYRDLEPSKQMMYLPKFGHIEMAKLFPILDQMLILKNRFSLENQLPLQALLSQFFVVLQKNLRAQTNSRSQKLSEQIINYLYMTSDTPFRLDDLSKRFNFHIDYLSKCLKKHTGMTPLQYANRIKIERAKALLYNSDKPLKEIVSQVGFTDYNYFLRVFRQHTGISPAKYRSGYLNS